MHNQERVVRIVAQSRTWVNAKRGMMGTNVRSPGRSFRQDCHSHVLVEPMGELWVALCSRC